MCFENRYGGFIVGFFDQEILHEHGGEEGIPAVRSEDLVYGFYNIPVCTQEPLVIQYSSASPAHVVPHDRFGIINFDLFHRVWGCGLTQGLLQSIPTEDGRFHIIVRNVFTFPTNPIP